MKKTRENVRSYLLAMSARHLDNRFLEPANLHQYRMREYLANENTRYVAAKILIELLLEQVNFPYSFEEFVDKVYEDNTGETVEQLRKAIAASQS